ncbi:MAG: hypothetical protein V2A79_02640 [Planctomycetota bacterium]
MPPRRVLGRPRCRRLSLLVFTGAAVCGGCGPQGTRFEVVDHRTEGGPTPYFEDFDECYYMLDSAGHFDCVARRIGTGEKDPDERITQVVHLHGIWHPDPGRTYAEQTMINATVSYLIVSSAGGASFEGGGFVSFRENYGRTLATGKLELAKLAPVRRLGESKPIFERAEIKGEFMAVHDARRVVRILSEMRRLFGPLPRYEPSQTDADVL